MDNKENEENTDKDMRERGIKFYSYPEAKGSDHKCREDIKDMLWNF